jgi:hypothetical protein
MNAHPRLLVVQLNEVNFDVVARYLESHSLPAFRRLISTYKRAETFAEQDYQHLEPWIQWVSAHTGKSYAEHGIFRLGDMANSDLPQIFERLEAAGLRVGALSPMNARNSLRQPAYFVPDPWTQTASDGSSFSERVTEMLRQTVNENASGRISAASVRTLVEATLRTLHPGRTLRLLRMIVASRGRPWMKAMVLDQVVHMLNLYLMAKTRPDVAFVFLNAGAHIQHHYFLNSACSGVAHRNPDWYAPADRDPVLEMLEAYDPMLADCMALAERGTRLILATGLTQVPYDRVKFYYRLRDHASFLARSGIAFATVHPRMTRDFEIAFDSPAQATLARARLEAMRMKRDGKALFGDIEDRGRALFLSLIYPEEIRPDDEVVHGDVMTRPFYEDVVFVAIKNGMHSTRGFVFVSPDAPVAIPAGPVHVSALYGMTLAAAEA